MLKEFAWPFGLMGGIYAYFVRFVPEETTVSVWATAAIAAVLLSIIIALWWHLAQRESKAAPEVLVEQILFEGTSFLTEATAYLGFDMGARAYYRDGKHELLIGTGVVRNVQADRRCLLEIAYELGLTDDLMQKMKQNDDGTRGRIRLRPGIIIKDN